ncbi:MAG TPA: hypothetical protein VFB19_16665 [Mycobacterium sp.]|nr:hypothetical protein [Mycobacterium sp.]
MRCVRIAIGVGAGLIASMLPAGVVPAADAADLAGWLSQATSHVSDIHLAESDALAAILAKPFDGNKLQGACTRLGDANTALEQQMPAPDNKLNVEVQQALDNFESAAQYCPQLVASYSKDNVDQFESYLKLAEQHFGRADTILDSLSQKG